MLLFKVVLIVTCCLVSVTSKYLSRTKRNFEIIFDDEFFNKGYGNDDIFKDGFGDSSFSR